MCFAQRIYYVTGEYIDTLGCFPSSKLCGKRLNISDGRRSVACIQNLWITLAKGAYPPSGEINLKGMTFMVYVKSIDGKCSYDYI